MDFRHVRGCVGRDSDSRLTSSVLMVVKIWAFSWNSGIFGFEEEASTVEVLSRDIRFVIGETVAGREKEDGEHQRPRGGGLDVTDVKKG